MMNQNLVYIFDFNITFAGYYIYNIRCFFFKCLYLNNIKMYLVFKCIRWKCSAMQCLRRKQFLYSFSCLFLSIHPWHVLWYVLLFVRNSWFSTKKVLDRMDELAHHNTISLLSKTSATRLMIMDYWEYEILLVEIVRKPTSTICWVI